MKIRGCLKNRINLILMQSIHREDIGNEFSRSALGIPDATEHSKFGTIFIKGFHDTLLIGRSK